ncbi:hypothetical protein ACU686_17345 [Yinghuangia aomiensis]
MSRFRPRRRTNSTKAAARVLIRGGVKAVSEGANMPTTPEAAAPAARGRGGVRSRQGRQLAGRGGDQRAGDAAERRPRGPGRSPPWKTELAGIMRDIHDTCWQTAGALRPPRRLCRGANIAGFERVADAMLEQGII